MCVNRIKILVLLILLSTSSVFAQRYNQGNGQRGGRNQSIVERSDTAPNPEDQKKEFQEKLEKHIQNFINTLEVDEFQKHIIKQRLHSYFVEKQLLFKSGLENREALEEKILQLDNTHFNDLNEMTPMNIQDSIQKFIKIKEIKPRSRKKEKRKKKKPD